MIGTSNSKEKILINKSSLDEKIKVDFFINDVFVINSYLELINGEAVIGTQTKNDLIEVLNSSGSFCECCAGTIEDLKITKQCNHIFHITEIKLSKFNHWTNTEELYKENLI